MDDDIRAHYEQGVELGRLVDPAGAPKLELARTLELLDRFIPPPPADVLDVGGGPGVYATIFSERGYRVRLVDLLPLHVEHARAEGIDAVLGDARALEEADETYDVALLLGPLYHLTERIDRVRALREAHRVLRPGGMLAAAAISRIASLLDGLKYGRLSDPTFLAIAERDLRDGQHRNPDPAHVGWFTTAFFHRAEELDEEIREAGFTLEDVFGVEGPAYWFEAERDVELFAARATEADPAARAMSAHLLAVARKR